MKPEIFQTLFKSKVLKVERIISCGQATPKKKWLKSQRNEWVTLLSGKARLKFKTGRVLTLKAGGSVFIRSGRPHRVEWTKPYSKTVWLAVHF
jgi:cupin 2 domain-containing protein